MSAVGREVRRPRRGQALASIVAAAGLVALASGCLAIPVPTSRDAESRPVSEVQPEAWLVSVGARSQLEDLGARLTRADGRLERVDALAFRDAALADGPPGLDALLSPAARERAEALGVDYVVLVGPPGFRDEADVNAFLIFFGFWGLAVIDEQAQVAALVVDFPRGQVVDAIASRATGKAVLAGFFFGLFLVPWTRSGADRALAEELAESLARLRPDGPLRLVVMSAEPRSPTGPPLLGPR